MVHLLEDSLLSLGLSLSGDAQVKHSVIKRAYQPYGGPVGDAAENQGPPGLRFPVLLEAEIGEAELLGRLRCHKLEVLINMLSPEEHSEHLTLVADEAIVLRALLAPESWSVGVKGVRCLGGC